MNQCEVQVDLQVTSVRSRGRCGGAIFAGDDSSGTQYVVVCDYSLVSDGAVVEPGQYWSVRGMMEDRMVARGGAIRRERQVSATSATLRIPDATNLIDWIASCSDCRGIGRVRASRLWDEFGRELPELIEKREIGRLCKVVGDDAARALCDAFEKYDAAAALVWLDQLRIPTQIGAKVVEYFGSETRDRVEANPFVLLAFEARWSIVDELATKKFCIAEADPIRLEAAVEEALNGAMRDGHMCLPADKLRVRLRRLLRKTALADLAADLSRQSERIVWVGDQCQSIGAYLIESELAARFSNLSSGSSCTPREGLFDLPDVAENSLDTALQAFEAANFVLEGAQREAVIKSAKEKCSLILGGAGTGKTTVLKALYHVLEATEDAVAIYQMALAGRAAQRMEQATGRPSSTIAAFLATTDFSTLGSHAVVVVDEMSMVDAILMYRLLSSIPPGTRLVFVGDPSQLPPIGPGLVLHALVGRGNIPQTELTVVRRQRAASGIPHAAAAVRQHLLPAYANPGVARSGVSFVDVPVSALNKSVCDLYRSLGGTGRDYEVQVLSTTRQGPGGVVRLNQLLHEQVGARSERVTAFSQDYECEIGFRTLDGRGLFVGDLVMQSVSDYELGLRNGALGQIVEALPCRALKDPCCVVEFDGIAYKLCSTQLQAIRHSYSITVHKSQGSQFRKVIVPVRASRLLDQALVYTALTRAVEGVVFVGDRMAFERAILSPALAETRWVTLPAQMEVRL